MIIAGIGDAFNIDLTSTPSTGFRWQISDLPDGIELVDTSFTQAAGAQPGDGGTQHFRLRANKLGTFILTATLSRPWEVEAIQTQLIEVEIG